MPTKYPPSRYELLREASYSEDPSFFLEILKNSIRNSQEQDGGEVTIGQVQEHMKMEGFVDAAKRSAEGDLYSFKSDGLYSFKTKLAILYACFIFGVISCHLFYNLYLGQELSFEIRAVSIATIWCSPMFVIAFSTIGGSGRGNWLNPLYNENYNAIKVTELKERQLKLIDCYLNQVLPMKAEIPALRYRHDVLTMISVGEWVFYAFFRACYSMYHLSYNWSNKEIREVDTMDAAISGAVFLFFSLWLIYWYFSKLAPVKHTKQADCGAVHF
ncbi:hypothetical protein CRE_11254 [Caenorhabditis remanei]|uniref:Uncharacterized protein n=1 Tax=Caenorhabditis remanei TaxID=31234 RepID=E3MQ69_CAERE|nr:hypothetical protein CRE_11254 [Caenorhabditis remanei]